MNKTTRRSFLGKIYALIPFLGTLAATGGSGASGGYCVVYINGEEVEWI